MLTWQELKEKTNVQEYGIKMPTAKDLRETGEAVAEKQLGNDIRLTVYRNGYALYCAYGHSTVFPIALCGAYLYASNEMNSYLSEQFFEKEPWYVRLVLEGEDRLDRNQKAREWRKTVSYNAVSEEWDVMGDAGNDPLEYLVDKENREEMLHCLTERQRMAVCLCFFQQKTRKEAAAELGISSPAVSVILSQAMRRLRKKYHFEKQSEKAVSAV